MSALESKVAFVSGGADGIGLAVVERFIQEGARVAVLDINQEKLAALQAQHPERVCTVCGDVTSYEDNQKVVELALQRFGRLDTFVGNAAIFDYFAPLSRIQPEQLASSFDRLFRVNVLGYMNGVKASLDALKASQGNIVLTVSNSGFYPGGGGILYVTSKHAVVGLIKQLAYELAPDIRVNGVSPGATDTEMKSVEGVSRKSQPLNHIEGFHEKAAQAVPLKRIAAPADHTSLYVLLASNEQSPMTTGCVIHSDGGWIAR